MSFQNYSYRELKLLKYINTHKFCTCEKMGKRFGRHVLGTLSHMTEKGIITKYEPFGVTVRGAEVLEDFKIYRNTVAGGRLIDAGIALAASLIGVIVGYLLSLIQKTPGP